MTGSEFIEHINNVDDDLIFEAEHWVRPKARNLRLAVCTAAAVCAACLCFAVGLTLGHTGGRDIPPDITVSGIFAGGFIAPGDEIYPTVMVNGKLYECKQGAAIIDLLPVGSVYYGEINCINDSAPKNDRDFVSGFLAFGSIFVDPDDDRIYIELTTDWFKNKIVVFEPVTERIGA